MKKRPLTVIVLLLTTGAIALCAWFVPSLSGNTQGTAVSAKPNPSLVQPERTREDSDLVQVSERTAAEREAVADLAPEECALEHISECADLAAELAVVLKHAADLEHQQEMWENHPDDSPWGAFLQSDEAEFITDPEIRADLEGLLGVVEVYLEPGEATWIAGRIRADDWIQFYNHTGLARTVLLQYFGPERCYRDMPPNKKLKDRIRGQSFEKEWLAIIREYEAADKAAEANGTQ